LQLSETGHNFPVKFLASDIGRETSIFIQKVKADHCQAGDVDSTLGSGRSPGGENGNWLQYSCWENPMDRRAWQATAHGVAKIWTRLSGHTQYSRVEVRSLIPGITVDQS